MRFVTTLFVLFVIAVCPAWADFKGPSASPAAAVNTVLAAMDAAEGATCVLEGKITEHLMKDRYTFADDSGSIVVNIPPHVFGPLEVTPENTVRITGEIRGKMNPNRQDTHLGVRYLEILK